MEKERIFVQQLTKMVQLARTQGNQLTKEQMESLFKELALEEEKRQPIYEYLKQNRIRIGEEEEEDDLSEEDKTYLDLYLEEIEAFEASEEERRAVMLSVLGGNEEAQATLIEQYLPQVVTIAKLYAGQGVLLEDLIGEGNIALMLSMKLLVCAETAEEAEGIIGKQIMDRMEAHINENLTFGEADKKVVDEVNKIAEGVAELTEILGRKVTIEELVRETKFTEAQIREAIEITAHNLEGIEDRQNGIKSRQ